MTELNPTPAPAGRAAAIEWLSVVARWALGGLFMYMGLVKALHPEQFLKLVREYDAVTQPLLLNAIGAALPWFEVWCGLLLVAGVAVRGTAVNLLAMLLPFTALIWKRALAVSSAQAIALCAVKFDCGCGTGEVFVCPKLAENTAMMLVALWLAFGHGRRLSLRYALLPPSPEPLAVS